MTSGIPLDNGAIASTVLQGIMYGVSLPLFGWTIWTLHIKRSSTSGRIDRRMLSVAILLFLLSTADMIINIIRCEAGLVLYRDTYPGGPNAYFANVSEWTFVYGQMTYILQTVLGDGVVIYRCHMVWQSVRVIIIPATLWLGVAASGFGALYAVAHSSDASNVFAHTTASWITAFFAFSLTTNAIGTSLLAYRVWTIDRNVNGHRINKSPLASVLRTILDAGIIYSVTLIATLTCFAVESNGQFFIINMNTPIISNVFFMVIIRVGIPRAQSQRPRGPFNPRSMTNDDALESGDQCLNEMKIHITKLVETSHEGPSSYASDISIKDDQSA